MGTMTVREAAQNLLAVLAGEPTFPALEAAKRDLITALGEEAPHVPTIPELVEEEVPEAPGAGEE